MHLLSFKDSTNEWDLTVPNIILNLFDYFVFLFLFLNRLYHWDTVICAMAQSSWFTVYQIKLVKEKKNKTKSVCNVFFRNNRSTIAVVEMYGNDYRVKVFIDLFQSTYNRVRARIGYLYLFGWLTELDIGLSCLKLNLMRFPSRALWNCAHKTREKKHIIIVST